MTFTTPCFVRVENPEKRKELCDWLRGIGYDVCRCCLLDSNLYCSMLGEVHSIPDCGIGLFEAEEAAKERPAIDCGKNTELFKALAAMNYENDREQWFTDGYHFELCPTNKADMVAWHMMYRTKPRKATAEEIVEYFKNKER